MFKEQFLLLSSGKGRGRRGGGSNLTRTSDRMDGWMDGWMVL